MLIFYPPSREVGYEILTLKKLTYCALFIYIQIITEERRTSHIANMHHSDTQKLEIKKYHNHTKRNTIKMLNTA